MKTYSLKLKGTKKNNTQDVTVKVLGNNKSQAFNFAYQYFEKGESHPNVADFIPSLAEFTDLKGKYFVPRTALSC